MNVIGRRVKLITEFLKADYWWECNWQASEAESQILYRMWVVWFVVSS